MPPLLLIWLLLLASNLMTSSEGSISRKIDVRFDCDRTDYGPGCEDLRDVLGTGAEWKFTCPTGHALIREQVQLLRTDKTSLETIILPKSPAFKASCVPKCHQSLAKHNCPPGLESHCSEAEFSADKKFACKDPTHTLVMNESLVKSPLTCDDSTGWKDSLDILILTFEQGTEEPVVEYYCHQNCNQSMVVDTCSTGACAAEPTYDATGKRLACSDADHYLLIDDVVHNNVTCSVDGWKSTNPPLEIGTLEKIKAKCYSKCHLNFIKTDCVAPCSKPIYLNEGGALFCRSTDEVLVFKGNEVSDLVCNRTTGWTDTSGKRIVDFADPNTSITSTAYCRSRSRRGNSTTNNDSTAESHQLIGGLSNTVLIVIGVVLVVIITACIAVFFCYIRKKKRNSEADGSNKTTSSKKTISGKKDSGKRGKKSKKSKKEFGITIDSNIEMPGHQMSAVTSGMPLTAEFVRNKPHAVPAGTSPDPLVPGTTPEAIPVGGTPEAVPAGPTSPKAAPGATTLTAVPVGNTTVPVHTGKTPDAVGATPVSPADNPNVATPTVINI